MLPIALILSGIFPTAGRAKDSNLQSFGDVMQIALPAAGLAGTFIADDPEGRYQWLKAVGGTVATVHVWKIAADKTRPDAVGERSFPSGHTAGAFSGAAFIDSRYGHWWGIPAYLCAIATGYSRVNADAHFWNDVVAGASTAMMFNWYFTSPYSERVSLLPAEIGDGYGMKLTVTDGGGTSGKNSMDARPHIIKYPNYTYTFKFGSAWQDKDVVRAPNSGGTEFDFNDYENIDEPITTAIITLDIALAERHRIQVGFAPYENRDRTISTAPFTFGSDIFPTDQIIRSAYRLNEIRAHYSYGLLLNEQFSLFTGGGLAWEEVSVDIQQGDDLDNPILYEEVKDSVFLPYLYLRGGYNFTDKVEGILEIDGITLNDDKMFNLFAGFDYRFNYHWSAGAGYAYSAREIDTDQLYNNYVFQGVLAHVAYTF